MNPNHALGNYWGPIEYRETGLFEIDQKLISKSGNKFMSYFSDFNHMLYCTIPVLLNILHYR